MIDLLASVDVQKCFAVEQRPQQILARGFALAPVRQILHAALDVPPGSGGG